MAARPAGTGKHQAIQFQQQVGKTRWFPWRGKGRRGCGRLGSRSCRVSASSTIACMPPSYEQATQLARERHEAWLIAMLRTVTGAAGEVPLGPKPVATLASQRTAALGGSCVQRNQSVKHLYPPVYTGLIISHHLPHLGGSHVARSPACCGAPRALTTSRACLHLKVTIGQEQHAPSCVYATPTAHQSALAEYGRRPPLSPEV